MKQLRNYTNKLRNACGPEDGSTTKIFKNVFDVIGNGLLDVVNNSLEYGSFPDIWKISKVRYCAKNSEVFIQCLFVKIFWK